jgi:hypothetical protein
MPKMTIEGLHEASAKQGFDPLVNGDYVVEIVGVETSRSKNDDCDMFNFQAVVQDGPEQDEDGTVADGRRVFHRIVLMDTDHPKAEYRYIGLGQFKALAEAAGVKITSGDNINVDDFIGQEVVFQLRTEKVLDADGEETGDLRNVVKKVKAVK